MTKGLPAGLAGGGKAWTLLRRHVRMSAQRRLRLRSVNGGQLYQAVLARAARDPHVLGLVVGGGRGKGLISETSDYDIALVLEDGAPEEVAAAYRSLHRTEVFDIHVFTLDEFRRIGAWETDSAWAAYGFAHLAAEIDKTGAIQSLLDLKGTIPPERIAAHVEASLDAFLNQYYRAFKNHRDGRATAARLDAAESIPLLLTVLFGWEGRVRPYNKFLEWELAQYPLACLPWSVDRFLALLRAVVEDGDIGALTELYRRSRDTATALGFTEAVSGWAAYTLEAHPDAASGS